MNNITVVSQGGNLTLKLTRLLPARGNMDHFLILSSLAPYLNSRLDSYMHLSTESLRFLERHRHAHLDVYSGFHFTMITHILLSYHFASNEHEHPD